MIKFKQKDFSKKLSSAVKYVKDHPILPLSAASLGVGIANYRTNTKRQKEGVEQHKAQLVALKSLNESVNKNSEALSNVNRALLENTSTLVIKNETKGNQPNQKKIKNSLIKRIFKRKEYSIQDGGFKGRKIEPVPTSVGLGAGIGAGIGGAIGLGVIKTGSGAAVGAILGAGIGALATWLSNVAEKSIFNSGLTRGANSYTLIKYLERYYSPQEDEVVETSTSKTDVVGGTSITQTRKTISSPRKSSVNPIGTLFNVDSDPKKCVVNILLRGNVMVLLMNKPTSMELMKANSVLDSYCRSYKMADYKSEKIDSNMYLVEINIVQSTEGSLVIGLIQSGLKVNILTTDRFGIKNR